MIKDNWLLFQDLKELVAVEACIVGEEPVEARLEQVVQAVALLHLVFLHFGEFVLEDS